MIEMEFQQILIKEQYINSETLSKYGFEKIGEQFRIDAPRFVMVINKFDDIGVLYIKGLATLDLNHTVLPILFNMFIDGILMTGMSKDLVAKSIYNSMIEYNKYIYKD